MKNTIELIKCLIASPSDVAKERDICEEVFGELNRETGDILGFRFESVRWEKDTHAGCGDYVQDVINQQFDTRYRITTFFFPWIYKPGVDGCALSRRPSNVYQ